MRLKAVRSLLRTNIIYTTQPATLARYRKKQANNPKKKIDIAKNMMSSYLFAGLLYAFLFGAQAMMLPLVSHSGLFSNLVGMFYLFIFSQGFLAFYNVFYESKDLQAYRPYAFSEGEVLIGKGFSVLLTTLMGLFPIIIYFIALQIQLKQPFWIAIPLVLLSLGILFLTISFLLLVGVHFVTKTVVFRKYKKLFSNLLLTLATLIGFGAIIMVNMQNSSSMGRQGLQDQTTFFAPIKALHDFNVNPFAPASLLGIGLWILTTVLLFVIIRKKVLPEFYDAAVTTTASVAQKKQSAFRITSIKDFPQFVWRYQLNLISDGSVFLQSILMSTIMPYFFLGPTAMAMFQKDKVLDTFLTAKFAFPMMLLVTFIGMFNAGGTNLTSIGISLERENYYYLKVLPFDMKRYLNLKFWDLFILQSIFPLGLLLVACLLIGLSLPLVLLMVVTWVLTCLPWSAWSYQRDKRLLVTNWSNVTELFNRDNSMVKVLVAILALIVYIIIIIVSAIFIYRLPDIIGYALAFALFIILTLLAVFLTRYFLKKVHEEAAG